jgi:hypothetical protein
MFKMRKQTKNYSKIYECPESGEKFGLLAINGNLKNKIMENLRENFIAQGDHIKNGGAISKLCIPTLLAGGSGALGLSAAASGTLFMATANPATLMAIGNGVGSAVMGAGGIVGQAPFIAVSSAIMPVAAPLLAFQALSTIMVLQQFKTVNEKLDNMQREVSRILQRYEATFTGELISAGSRLEALEKEHDISSKFTNDMMMRLALIEDKVNPIFERYRYLYDAQIIDKSLSVKELELKHIDAYMATLLSILDLRIDILRVKLTLQENPAFLKTLATNFVEKVKRYQTLWYNIENNPQQVEELAQSLKEAVSAMNGWQKVMPRWLGGKRDQRKLSENTKEALFELNTRNKTEGMVEAARSALNFGESIINDVKQATLLYWEDEMGKHSYYTNDLMVI